VIIEQIRNLDDDMYTIEWIAELFEPSNTVFPFLLFLFILKSDYGWAVH